MRYILLIYCKKTVLAIRIEHPSLDYYILSKLKPPAVAGGFNFLNSHLALIAE